MVDFDSILVPRSGILPIAKSTVLDLPSGWSLPGRGVAYGDCGNLRFRGCLNVEHHHEALDREQNGKAFVTAYRRSCGRKECPICCESWASLEADRAEYRLSMYRGRWRKPIHFSVNPSPELWGIPYEKLRSSTYRVAKRAGIVGACMVYHNERQDSSKKWFFSPHFHGVGYGWHRGFSILGWVVKNHGIRKSVYATLAYLLSHAGVHKDYHTTTWFGALSYNKLKVPPPAVEKPKCPLCGAELVKLFYVGNGRVPPPDMVGNYFLERGDWIASQRWG